MMDDPALPLASLSLGFMCAALALEPFHVAPYVVLWHLLFLIASCAATRMPAKALVGAGLALYVPLFVETTNAVRCMHGMAWITHYLRLIRVVERSESFSKRSPLFRVAYVHYFHDITRTTEAKSGDLQSLVVSTTVAACSALLASAGLSVASRSDVAMYGRLWLLVRWTLGGFMFAPSIYILDGIYRLPLLASGKNVPSALQNPLRARSVKEFWGHRWNRVIGGMLREGIFEPCRARGLKFFGVVLTFLASGALHVVPMMLSGQPTMVCGAMFLFFVIQIPILSIERGLGMHGAAWVWLSLGTCAPLFIEPFLRCFEAEVDGDRAHISETLLYFYGLRSQVNNH